MSKRPLSATEIEKIRQVAAAENLYEVLGVSPGTNKDTIEATYRAYVREWHPDRFFSRDCNNSKGENELPNIENNFVEATRAFETLRDERRRKEYDNELMAMGKMPGAIPAPRTSPADPRGSDPREIVVGRPSVAPTSTVGSRPANIGLTAPSGQIPTPNAPPPKAPPLAAIAALKAQVAAQQGKAMEYLTQAKQDFDAGRFVKAEGTLYLALKILPKHPEINELDQKASARARQTRAEGLLVQAEQAEQYGRHKEALAFFEKAVENDPAEGKAWFQLARIRKQLGEQDQPRDLLPLYRKACMKSPKVFEYRIALAEIYLAMDMTANAHREAGAALEIDPKSDIAKQLHRKTRPW